MPEFIANETAITVTIELKDISRKDYDDILMYIRTKLDASCLRSNEPAKRTAHYEELWEMIDRIYAEYYEDPKSYILKQMSAIEFVNAFPEFSGFNVTPVGRILSKASESYGNDRFPKGAKKARNSKGKTSGFVNTFTVPVRCPTLGDKIRMFREEARLSQKELANKIRYPIETVAGWEKNVYTPNSNAIKELIDIFGGDFARLFEKEEEE